MIPLLVLSPALTPGLQPATRRLHHASSNIGMVESAAAAQPANGVDDAYPWRFDGRLWFRPAFVRAPEPDALPEGMSAVSLFGWTVGGVVALEYDESPVGPYREYVSMGAVVTKRGALGQWGSRLYVSSAPAEAICKEVWGVPAETAEIEFVEAGEGLRVEQAPPPSVWVAGRRRAVAARCCAAGCRCCGRRRSR